jgi:hypothetical protein
MKGRDYIPRGDDAFLDWARNFIAVLAEYLALWGVLQSVLDALKALFADYEVKLEKSKSANRGKVDVAEKNAAKKALMSSARNTYKLYIAWNPAVTDAQKEEAGVPIHDQTRTTIPVPKTRPEFNLKVVDLMQIQIDFHDQGSSSQAIPYGDSGALLFYTVADAPVLDYEKLSKTALLTHSRFILTLPPDSQGKILSAALVWQNKKGEKGNWSEIQSIVIP